MNTTLATGLLALLGWLATSRDADVEVDRVRAPVAQHEDGNSRCERSRSAAIRPALVVTHRIEVRSARVGSESGASQLAREVAELRIVSCRPVRA